METLGVCGTYNFFLLHNPGIVLHLLFFIRFILACSALLVKHFSTKIPIIFAVFLFPGWNKAAGLVIYILWVIHMKRAIAVILIILSITAGIPFLIVKNFTSQTQPPPDPAASGEPVETISVYVKATGQVVEMQTAQYLKEVVAAEMPATFYDEALKAQAVAARTYLLNRVNVHRAGNEVPEHHGADICTDATHCKAWLSEADRKTAWGEAEAEANWNKIANAVDSTSGVIITYNSQPISAVFHSTSSGHTENAKDVWGGDVPYLVSVESAGEDLSPRFKSERDLTLEEFKQIAEQELEQVDWNKGIIGETVRSDAGGIITIEVGGTKIKGTQFRTMYDLRSTNVEINIEGDMVKIGVTGFGHGVGMSQYGANYLASQGKNYVEILKTYYTGVEVGA